MNAVKQYWPYLAIAFAGFLLIVLAEPVQKWVVTSREKPSGLIAGRVTQGLGTIHRIHGAKDETLSLPIDKPIVLYNGDRVQTAAASKASLILNSQDEIEIEPESAVELQLWNPKDSSSPIYLNMLAGSINSRRAGVKGKAYMVKDGRLYLPGQTPAKKAVALTVLRKAPLDMHLNETVDTGPEETSPETSPSGADPETLSNEYIDETILAHQAQMQKCWLSRLKDAPTLKGQIIVQFEISSRGKVKEARIADATLNDEVLQRCVLSVIERIPFRPFKGSEISLSYPINFE